MIGQLAENCAIGQRLSQILRQRDLQTRLQSLEERHGKSYTNGKIYKKNTFETTQSDLWWEFSWKIHIAFSKQQTSNQNKALLEQLNVGVTVEKSYILNSCPTLKHYWTTINITVSHNTKDSLIGHIVT